MAATLPLLIRLRPPALRRPRGVARRSGLRICACPLRLRVVGRELGDDLLREAELLDEDAVAVGELGFGDRFGRALVARRAADRYAGVGRVARRVDACVERAHAA